ncbi:MAG: Smr/MutS family protein [Casimicrobiaceae bacterium]
MAKLSQLKDLLAAANARKALAEPPRKATPAPAPPVQQAAKRSVAATKHADGDIDLARAFADVHKLKNANKAAIHRPRPAPIARHTLADERDVLEASKYGNDPAPQTWDTGQEFEHEQTFVRSGLPADIAGKLRRGHWSVQAELDLHGHTVDEAHDALSDFIVESRSLKFRCVRVIHGKGLTSPQKEPILKGKVRRWLSHWDEVLAYTEAPRHAGGSGAVVILLKGS